MMNIKPIKTKDDYKEAMVRISDLTNSDPDALPDNEFYELEVLTALAEVTKMGIIKMKQQIQQ
ncbi:hypothetical protein [Aliivibrio fischeri]|uniref:hypothetical protein n=1 Tax=Aliivibrio fischeri TaxID=668 RepID=UPI001F229252|nr:hypothetical protein [Aliivibrio fischeri]